MSNVSGALAVDIMKSKSSMAKSDEISIAVIPFGTKCGKKILIDFNDNDNRYTLYHEYDSIKDLRNYDKVVAVGEDGKKTEFRAPFIYNVSKEKAREFWEDLTEHGWRQENAII
jgi:hypothetical protein